MISEQVIASYLAKNVHAIEAEIHIAIFYGESAFYWLLKNSGYLIFLKGGYVKYIFMESI